MAHLPSPYPPQHRQCAIGSLPIPDSQVLGILEGDATVSFRAGAQAIVRPRIVVATRDDDVTPLALWASVGRARGRALGWLRRRAEYRRNEWIVDDPQDLLELVDWLTQAGPLPPRMDALLDLARRAALVILAGRSDPDRNSTELAGLAARARATNRGRTPLPLSACLATAGREHLAWVFSGLFAADGSLALRNRHARFAPVAVVSQRCDNAPLLRSFANGLGIGELHAQGRQVYLRVSRLPECRALAEILREFPLPASSPRRRQLDTWSRALALRDSRPSRSSALAALCDELRAAKRYSGPRLLCSCSPPAPIDAQLPRARPLQGARVIGSE